jgi:chemotaxis signal transduction protein
MRGEKPQMPSPTDLATTRPTTPATIPAPSDQDDTLLLVVTIGARRFALPAAAIVRVLPMAAPIPLPDAPPGVVGALPFRGAILPVVDPRPRLGQPGVAPRPEQHLIAVAAEARYLLWVDRAETVVAAPAPGRDDPAAPQLIRLGDDFLTFLPAAALAPAAETRPR